jgi:nucleoside-diphosphate-sugar epimerase
MESKRNIEQDKPLKKDDLIVITGAGGFIAGNLALYFKKKGFTNIRAADKKPLCFVEIFFLNGCIFDTSNIP